jgi:hypothetical protein
VNVPAATRSAERTVAPVRVNRANAAGEQSFRSALRWATAVVVTRRRVAAACFISAVFFYQ